MDQLVESIRTYLARDWGPVLLTLTAIFVALTFVGAPRAISEIIGMVIEAYLEGGRNNDLGWLFLLAGAPAGLFARNWKNALVLIFLGFLITMLADLGSPSGAEETGQMVVGVGITTSIVAAGIRLVILNTYVGKFENDTNQSFLDIARNRGAQVAVVAVAIIGIAQLGGRSVADDHYYDDAASIGSVAEGAAAVGSDSTPYFPTSDFEGFESPIEDRIEAAEPRDNLSDEGVGAESGIDFSGILDEQLEHDNIFDREDSDSNPGGVGLAAEDSPEIAVFAPSFDCEVYEGRVEEMICSDKDLAERDVRLDSMFKAKLADAPDEDRREILLQQRIVLVERNACVTKECVSNWYSRELKNY